MNVLTWWRGLSSSASHALIGGLCGAVLVAAGGDHVAWGWRELVEQRHLTGLNKILATLMIVPLLGLGVGFVLHRVMHLVLRRAHPGANRPLPQLQ